MSSKYYCILDSDQIAIENVKQSISSALLSSNFEDVSYYTIEKNKEAELEDLVNPQQYANYIMEKFNINILESKSFIKGTSKWSKRIAQALKENGKVLIDKELKEKIEEIKIHISDLDINQKNFFIENRSSSIDVIVSQLEKYFK